MMDEHRHGLDARLAGDTKELTEGELNFLVSFFKLLKNFE